MNTGQAVHQMEFKPEATEYTRPRIGETVLCRAGGEEFEGEVSRIFGTYPAKPHVQVNRKSGATGEKGFVVSFVHPSCWFLIEKDPVAVFLEDTWKHVRQVQDEVMCFSEMLVHKSTHHDASKFGPEEANAFIETAPKLKEMEYDSEEYKASLAAIQPAIRHHYAHNDHHPEHFENGIDDMNLMQLVEMFCDWRAAVKRMKNGDMMKSIDVNEKRFSMSPQLANIFRNTEKAFRVVEEVEQIRRHRSSPVIQGETVLGAKQLIAENLTFSIQRVIDDHEKG